MMTLTLVFNQDATQVLMCRHRKQNAMNFIGGHVMQNEDPMDASYRELFEETGIGRDVITLKSVRVENVKCFDPTYSNDQWELYVTAGILSEPVILEEEKNPLEWINIDDIETFIFGFGYGNCYTYLREAENVLNIHQ